MERYTSVGIAAFGSVFQVAFYRTTDSRQLASYLVMSSGL